MCGVFGIRSTERDVARLAYFGLHALQHRGQESAGIVKGMRIGTVGGSKLLGRKLPDLHAEWAS